MNLSYEFLTSENARHLIAAQDEVLDGPVQDSWLRAFLEDPRHFMILAMQRGNCVGMVSGFEYFHPDKAPQVFLNEIGVSDAFQNQGIGRALVREVLREATRRGATYVWLGTEVDNLPARSCFSKVDTGPTWALDTEEARNLCLLWLES